MARTTITLGNLDQAIRDNLPAPMPRELSEDDIRSLAHDVASAILGGPRAISRELQREALRHYLMAGVFAEFGFIDAMFLNPETVEFTDDIFGWRLRSREDAGEWDDV